ncbi:hypothetical protein [Klebsiella michiganensis]|uniref:hypothetical protein n=1 Tax=Klebsiella michiganensis TaxID=1134687 RepID=UPI0022468405|nr:hypothetical protein [Klebsiella michiganensis]MCW9452154.1 hypothetical protein [Klebsiella michiganensis]
MTNTHCYYQSIQTTPATPGNSKTFRWPAIRQGEEMIREEDKTEWFKFLAHAFAIVVCVLVVSALCLIPGGTA